MTNVPPDGFLKIRKSPSGFDLQHNNGQRPNSWQELKAIGKLGSAVLFGEFFFF